MKETLITFETAKLAKEKGFPQLNQGAYFTKEKEHCLVGWGFNDRTDNSLAQYSAPTQSLLQKWLREVKEENITPPLFFGHQGYACDIMGFENTKYFKTYEEALENELYECLQRVSETVA